MHTYNGDPTNFPASLTMPDDGDDKDAASVLVPLEGLADRTAHLYDVNRPVIYAATHTEASDDPTSWSPWSSVTATTWTDIGLGGSPLLVTADLKHGDFYLVDVDVAAYVVGSGTDGALRLVGNDGSSDVNVAGSEAHVTTTIQRFHLSGFLSPSPIVPIGGTLYVDFKLQAFATASSTDIKLVGPAVLRVLIFRL